MQFRKKQREQMATNWKKGNWFFDQLEPLYRETVAKAYGCRSSKARERSFCQEVTSLAFDKLAAAAICDKSHVVHAFQTGAIQRLVDLTGLTILQMSKLTVKSFREAFNGTD